MDEKPSSFEAGPLEKNQVTLARIMTAVTFCACLFGCFRLMLVYAKEDHRVAYATAFILAWYSVGCIVLAFVAYPTKRAVLIAISLAVLSIAVIVAVSKFLHLIKRCRITIPH